MREREREREREQWRKKDRKKETERRERERERKRELLWCLHCELESDSLKMHVPLLKNITTEG